MKLQEARLKELEPQMEALQRQQAETHLVSFPFLLAYGGILIRGAFASSWKP